MVRSGLVELDVPEFVVTVGGKEEAMSQEAVTTNMSSNSQNLNIPKGHCFPTQPYLLKLQERGHSLENHFISLNSDPGVCWATWH